MLLLYTSDLHGSFSSYQQLLDLAVQTQADAMIVGGDLLPSHINAAQGFERQRSFILDELQPLFRDFRANYSQIPLYLLPGNDDWAGAMMAFEQLEAQQLVFTLHNRLFRLKDNLWLAGYACVPLTPYSIKDYERIDEGKAPMVSFAMAYTSTTGSPKRTDYNAMLSKPTIAQDLVALARRSIPQQTIYVCHAPPFGSMLDIVRGKHSGSKAMRSFIERYQPLLTLHGHIHEAPKASGTFAQQFGATWSVNAGHERERFSAVLLDTDAIADTLWHTLYGSLSSRERFVG